MTKTPDISHQQANRPSNEPQGSLPLAAGSATIRARIAGAAAAIAGKHIGHNPYSEETDCHWHWLDGWATTKMDQKKPNNPAQTREPLTPESTK